MCQYVKCFAKGVGVNRTIRNSFLMEVHFRRRKIRMYNSVSDSGKCCRRCAAGERSVGKGRGKAGAGGCV